MNALLGRVLAAILLTISASCASSPPLPPEAAALAGHLSSLERRNLAVVSHIHGGRSIIQRARESGAMADDVEWIVPGPPEVLPFAGTYRGLEGITEFQRRLGDAMRYDRVELMRYIAGGNDVAAIFEGEGIAKATGRPFKSEIMRVYTFRDGKIVRVQNFYDTAIYVAAVKGQ